MNLTIERNTLGFRLRTRGPVTMGNRTPRVQLHEYTIAQDEPQGNILEEVTASATRAEFINSDVAEELSTVSSSQTSDRANRAQTISYLAMRGAPPPPSEGGWRATVGMFANDPTMARIVEAGRQIREAERHE